MYSILYIFDSIYLYPLFRKPYFAFFFLVLGKRDVVLYSEKDSGCEGSRLIAYGARILKRK